MPIQDGKYVNPHWNNNAPPPLNASELNAISDTLENLDNIDYEKEVYKVGDVLITSRTDLDDTWVLANGETVDYNSAMYEQSVLLWCPMLDATSSGTNGFPSGYVSCINDGQYIYFLTFVNYKMNIVKQRIDGSEREEKELVSLPNISVTARYTNMSDTDNGYSGFCDGTNGIMCAYGHGEQSDTIYVVYSNNIQNINSWTYKAIDTVTGNMRDIKVYYMGNNYIVGLTYYNNNITSTVIYYGQTLGNFTKKTFSQIDSTNINNYTSAQLYYDNNTWYAVSFVVNKSSSDIYVNESNTIDQLNVSTDGTKYSPGVLIYLPSNGGCFISCDTLIITQNVNSVGRKIVCLDIKNNQCYTLVDADVNSTTLYPFAFEDKFGYVVHFQENNYYTYCLYKKVGNRIQNVIPYSTSESDSVNIRYGVSDTTMCVGLKQIVIMDDWYDSPRLPELSVNNAYAYVKVSSS